MTNFEIRLAQATSLSCEATYVETQMNKLRFDRDEVIICALYQAKSAQECLSLRPIASKRYQKCLISLLAIQHFNPDSDTISLLNEIRLLFLFNGENCAENSFRDAYNLHHSLQYLLSNRFHPYCFESWSGWSDFLYEHSEEVRTLFMTKRKLLVSQMDIAALDAMHKSMHRLDKMLVARFNEILHEEGIQTTNQLKSLFGRRPKQWMTGLLRQTMIGS